MNCSIQSSNQTKGKKMKYLILYWKSFLFTMILSTSANYLSAQTNDKIEKRVENLKQKLSLTEEQTSKVRIIIQNAAAEIKKEKTSMKESVKKEMKSANEQIELVLTYEQKVKYKELKEEKKAMIKEKRKGRKKE